MKLKSLLLSLCFILLTQTLALAQQPDLTFLKQPDRKFGGCFKQGQICAGPSAAIFVGQVNLKTGDFTGGLIPGAGYGVTFYNKEWYKIGTDIFLSMNLASEVNNIQTTLVLSFAEYLRFGFGGYFEEHQHGQPLLVLGIGANFDK